MANRDVPAHPERARPFGDEADEGARGVVAEVEVKVDRRMVTLGRREDEIEVAPRVAVDVRTSADDVVAEGHRRVEPLGHPRELEPALRKRHELERDAVAEVVLQRSLEVHEREAYRPGSISTWTRAAVTCAAMSASQWRAPRSSESGPA